MVTFAITVVEVVMLVLQIIHFLQRPSDNKRWQYLILLVLLIVHNIVAGLFPDKDYPIPFAAQTIAAYFVGFLMSIYAVYYFYKVFELDRLKFYATYGAVLFLLLPFLLLFVIPYLLTGNPLLSSRMAVVIPFFYGLGYVYQTARAFIYKFREQKRNNNSIDKNLYHNAIAAYIFAVCWASLPLVVFFGNFQVLAHSVTNAGFLVMTIVYVRSNIMQSREEYQKLLASERSLKELNTVLKRKVRLRTRKLEKLMKERHTTFINLAHETKTPLTLIGNYLNDHIKKNGLNDELRVVKKNIDRLTKDIVNLFDVESYEKGFNIYDHNQVCHLSDLLTYRQPLFRSYADRKGLTLSYSIAPSLTTKAHPGAIDRIVNNLVENAIKYSPEGGEVKVDLLSKDGQIIFSVSDCGPGIPEDQQHKVFEPYFKLSMPGASKEGMGMGLSIVKRIVQDLNGKIVLQSSPMGTHVTVTLCENVGSEKTIYPYIDSHDIHLATSASVVESTIDPEKQFLLIVEDNAEMLNFLISKLKEKYNVLFARNGTEALKRMDGLLRLDLIISDVMMPDMDGFAFCMAVQGKKKYAHIPFIFLTAKATDGDKSRGLEIGAVDYIQKPFSIDMLIKKVDSILNTLKKQRAAVVNRAYQNVLVESPTSSQHAHSYNENAFEENCKRYHLTVREIEIIQQLIRGRPYKLISDQLHISDKTVGKHVSNIFSKVGVNNKVELINRLQTLQKNEVAKFFG